MVLFLAFPALCIFKLHSLGLGLELHSLGSEHYSLGPEMCTLVFSTEFRTLGLHSLGPELCRLIFNTELGILVLGLELHSVSLGLERASLECKSGDKHT